jgi:hypothetical protein
MEENIREAKLPGRALLRDRLTENDVAQVQFMPVFGVELFEPQATAWWAISGGWIGRNSRRSAWPDSREGWRPARAG